MKDLKVKEFIADLGSKKPYPGGGSVSSLVGALSVSLSSMCASYTVASAKYADVHDEMEAMIARCNYLSDSLLDLMNRDAEGFIPLSKAYSIPKDDPRRDEIYQVALRKAAEAPLEMFEMIKESADIALYMYEKGSRLLKSDAECAAILALAALKCSAVIIRVNTREYDDQSERTRIDDRIDLVINEYEEKIGRR